nr:2-dehydro-3-deoxyphosphogluconate aldolase [Streptomyces sp. DSM 41633]
MTALDVLRSDRVLSVVRAETIPDAAALCHAIAEGGSRTVELTFTTPGVVDHLRSCAETVSEAGIMLGVGTVMTADKARAAIDAGARFLV